MHQNNPGHLFRIYAQLSLFLYFRLGSWRSFQSMEQLSLSKRRPGPSFRYDDMNKPQDSLTLQLQRERTSSHSTEQAQ